MGWSQPVRGDGGIPGTDPEIILLVVEMSMTIIVTRHTGLIQWLKSHGIVGDVISHVEFPDQIRGKDVYGVLPLHLASVCNSVTTVDMPGLPSEKRGIDISVEEMDAYGATMSRYEVRKVD